MKRKKISAVAMMMAASLVMTACGAGAAEQPEAVDEVSSKAEDKAVEHESTEVTADKEAAVAKAGDLSEYADAVQIVLSDAGITVNGEVAETVQGNAVYVSHDIIYYEDKDFYESGNPYGAGEAADKHSAEEAAAHTVVNITQPGAYQVTGSLSAGQLFVNVGEEETDKVTLILNGVDITCGVAPAVFFYQVYECDGEALEETATKDVDTSNAGARVILADGSVNNVNGSYVAKIYKDKDEKKKLHKYDGAFYSKASMEINGGERADGILNITAENEGLDSEMHLTIYGGNINICSVDDGVNTSEDNISVCTIYGGNLNIQASLGSEGDGIDSNGWLVLNGGTVVTASNPASMDSGLDSDKGIYMNGGTVISFGTMYDSVAQDSAANTMVLQFQESPKGDLSIMASDGTKIAAFPCTADYSYIVISTDALTEGTYSVYNGEAQLSHSGMMMGMGGARPELLEGEMFADGERPEKPEREMFADGERPEKPEGEMFADGERPKMPEGEMPKKGELPVMAEGGISKSSEKSMEFTVEKGVNFFGGIE